MASKVWTIDVHGTQSQAKNVMRMGICVWKWCLEGMCLSM